MLAANSGGGRPDRVVMRQGVAVVENAEHGGRDRPALRPRIIYNIGRRRRLCRCHSFPACCRQAGPSVDFVYAAENAERARVLLACGVPRFRALRSDDNRRPAAGFAMEPG